MPRVEPRHGLVERQYRVVPSEVGDLPLERLWRDEFTAIIENALSRRADTMIQNDFKAVARGEARERGEPPYRPERVEKPLHGRHSTPCSVLVIGTETALFEKGSEARQRAIAYGARFPRLDLIVFSRRGRFLAPDTLSAGVRAFPTASRSRFLYGVDAFRIARTLPRPDVVTVQDPFETGIVGWCVAKQRGVPLHVQVHTDFLSPYFARHSFINRLRVLIAGFVLRRASRIRVVSPRIKETINERYHPAVPVTVLPIYVAVREFRAASSDAELQSRFKQFKTKLLVVSRLEPEKNVALAIHACARATSDDTCLIIIGEGSARASLEKLAQKEGVAQRVFFEGRRSPAPYYVLVDLVLFPSFYDGYGRVIVEALAAGKPVLSTDVGIAREAGAIITEGHQFSDALLAWYKNGPRTAELSGYPYKDFDEYVQAYASDIESCVERKTLT